MIISNGISLVKSLMCTQDYLLLMESCVASYSCPGVSILWQARQVRSSELNTETSVCFIELDVCIDDQKVSNAIFMVVENKLRFSNQCRVGLGGWQRNWTRSVVTLHCGRVKLVVLGHGIDQGDQK